MAVKRIRDESQEELSPEGRPNPIAAYDRQGAPSNNALNRIDNAETFKRTVAVRIAPERCGVPGKRLPRPRRPCVG